MPSEYDRLNPATSKEALDEFQKFYEQEVNKIENASVIEQKNLFAQFSKQFARGHHNPQGGITAQHSIGTMFMPAQNQQIQNVLDPNFLQGIQTAVNQQPTPVFPNSFGQMNQQGSFPNRMSRHMGKNSWHNRGFAPHQHFGFHNFIQPQNGFQPIPQQSPGIIQSGTHSVFIKSQ